MLKGGTTCLKCGAKKNVIRFFSIGGKGVTVCSDCWRRMKKPERRAFLRSFEEAKNIKEETENGNGINGK